jgi:hypothetical protein
MRPLPVILLAQRREEDDGGGIEGRSVSPGQA